MRFVGQAATAGRRPALALALIPILIFAVQSWRRRWVCDDAFIDFRVVANVLAGHGPVYNIGERVEAYSNPVWVGLLAGLGAIGARLEPASVWLGWALAVAGLGLGALAAWRLASSRPPGGEQENRWLLPVGLSVFAALPPAWDFATSGLETGLGFAWLGGAYFALVRAALAAMPVSGASGRGTASDAWSEKGSARWFWIAALWLGLGPLVRPDFVVFTCVFGIALLLATGHRARPHAVGLTIAALAPLLAYEIFRMGTFAALVSNTTLAKEPTLARWSHGWLYLGDFVRPYALVVPIALAAMLWARNVVHARREHDGTHLVLLAAPAVAGILHAWFVVRGGGDFMHARLLLPSLWCAMLAVGFVAVPAPARTGVARGVWVAAIAVLAWSVLCAGWLRLRHPGGRGPTDIVDERGFYTWESTKANPIRIEDFSRMHFSRNGAYLRALSDSLASTGGPRILLLPRGSQVPSLPLSTAVPPVVQLAVASRNIGITGYVAGPRVHIVDVHGLADPLASRLPSLGTGRPGHDKMLSPAWIVGRYADVTPGYPAGAAAKEALARPPLSDLVAAVTAPLDAHRFFANMRLAPRLHRLRLPAEPLTPGAAPTSSPQVSTPPAP